MVVPKTLLKCSIGAFVTFRKIVETKFIVLWRLNSYLCIAIEYQQICRINILKEFIIDDA